MRRKLMAAIKKNKEDTKSAIDNKPNNKQIKGRKPNIPEKISDKN